MLEHLDEVLVEQFIKAENKETVAVTIGGNEVLTCANPSITLPNAA